MFLMFYCVRELYYLRLSCLYYPGLYLFSEFFEQMPFFDSFCDLYVTSYKNYFNYTIDNSISRTDNEKQELCLLGPHSMFLNAPISFALFGFTRNEIKKFKLFVAPSLVMNPIVNIFAKTISNGNKVQGLTHKNVVKNMKEQSHNLCVSVGGFEEVNLFGNTNVIYTGRFDYWIFQAIKHNYNITIVYTLGGTQDFRSILGNNFLSLRMKLAKMHIPFNIVYGKYLLFPFNNIPLTEISYRMELPHIPNITKEESKIYSAEFKKGFFTKILNSYPSNGQHPFEIIQ